MKLRTLLVVSLFSSLICSLPAEAASGGSEISTVAVGAMIIGVGVLALLMKKFME